MTTTKSGNSREVNLKVVKKRVIFWTVFAIVVAYSLLFLLTFAKDVHADAQSDCEAKTDGSQWNTTLKECRTIPQQCTDASPNNVWVDASGYGSDGKTYKKQSRAYCWYSANNGCGVDTFFNWGCDDSGGEQITPLLISILNWLAVGVTLAVVAGIIYGAVLYTTSGGNQEQAHKSIGIIRNAVVALILYFAMWALLNWLVPGGLFSN